MSNEQDNKPERTAMQELIDWIQENEIRMPNAQRIVAKAIEFRDTVEKEKIENAYSRGAEDENLHMTRNCPEPSSYKYYNEKYGTDGK